MAELMLTDEEKDAENYLDWDDDALGKLVRSLSAHVKDEHGRDGGFLTLAAHLLVDMALTMNATSSEIAVKGMTRANKPIGDWKIEVTRVTEGGEDAENGQDNPE